MSGTYKKEK